MTRYDELMSELESEGAAEWTEPEMVSFQAECERAFLAGELTREQYVYLLSES
jgi:hypothetical protein